LASTLLQELLKAGLVEVEENRQRSAWETRWVCFLSEPELRVILGLEDPAAIRSEWEIEAAVLLQDGRLRLARVSLEALQPRHALRRSKLLRSLETWAREGRSGTRRDFSQYARQDTKAISKAEWQWLEQHVNLPSFGVEQHTPALWLRAPLRLYSQNLVLDLHLVEDCIALTPKTLQKLDRCEGSVPCWRLVENRTSFERVARRYGDSDGVLWVPGSAPSWWKQVVRHLLDLCPAPAWIACDPDPSGVQILLDLLPLWSDQKLNWSAWRMDVETLSRMSVRKSLTPEDREILARLRQTGLPSGLDALLAWMDENGQKGEQEAIDL
jgi:hypothetical protein